MAEPFSAAVLTELNKNFFQLYNFVEIILTEPGFDSLYLTDYYATIDSSHPNYVDLGSHDWISGSLEAITPPPKTGEVSQEVQRIAIAQGLGRYYNTNHANDYLSLLGNQYHGAPCNLWGYVFDSTNNLLIVSDPFYHSAGTLKSVSRSMDDSQVIIEMNNAFGKMDIVRDLRTSTGSIIRRAEEDTCFDRAYKNMSRETLNWGGKP